MKTYLEIQVPIKYDVLWFEDLRNRMKDIPVIWQKDFYHITMAFIDETPEDVDMHPILMKHLGKAKSPKLTFDKLDVFEATSHMYIINLGVSDMPLDFLNLVENIRQEMKTQRCVMMSEFKLHVTLGRIKDISISMSKVKEILDSISLMPLSSQLTNVVYREFRGNIIWETKLDAK